MEHLIYLIPLSIAIGFCIGIIYGERHNRRANWEEMQSERFVLRETMQKIAESHNTLAITQKMQDETIHDINQKVAFMVQGIKGVK